MPARLRAAWMRPLPPKFDTQGFQTIRATLSLVDALGAPPCRVVQGTIRPEAKSQRARRETLQKASLSPGLPVAEFRGALRTDFRV